MQAALKRLTHPSDDGVVAEEELAARYEVRPRFLSEVELQVYRLLCAAAGDRALVCPKPRVFEALRMLDAAAHLEDALRIDRKHIDFLLVDPDSGRPLCAIQVDIWDEELQGYRLRETLLEEAFRRARLPVAYVLSDQLPPVSQLAQTIDELFSVRERKLGGGETHYAHQPRSTPGQPNQVSRENSSRQPHHWQAHP